jgi:protocatechuate 3,4-dioxygenase beta subunit
MGRSSKRLLERRALLKWMGGAVALAGCTSGGAGNSDLGQNDLAKSGSDLAGTCTVIPDETIGPYPDKTGMLSNATYNRSDVTEGKDGLGMSLVLSVVDVANGCAAVADAQVIIWHCDAVGEYSEYAGQPGFDGTGLTFLRGWQATDANGQVTFKTIYPGWYAGRVTHIHVQVFVGGTSKKATQIAFPETVTNAVYQTGVYAAKGQNPTTNATDMVFLDGVQEELANLTGDTTAGYTATLTIGI